MLKISVYLSTLLTLHIRPYEVRMYFRFQILLFKCRNILFGLRSPDHLANLMNIS